MSLPVSALILTKNEETHIARCLNSLLWVDEILVIDAQSTDRTLEICRDPAAPWAKTVKTLERPWTNFRDQRNYSLDQAAHDWVLIIDADEKCTPELSAHIQKLLSQPQGPDLNYYKIRRTEYFLGKEITGGIWNPSIQDRFFLKTGIRYINEVHEYPPFPTTPGVINEPLQHSPDFNPHKFLSKMLHYVPIEAQARFNNGVRTNVFKLFFAFFAMFLKNYFYYQAYRDGMHGFVISILEGISRAFRHIKLWELQQKPKT